MLNYPIVVYRPHSILLNAYCRSLIRLVKERRLVFQAKRAAISEEFYQLVSVHMRIIKAINAVKLRIRLLTKGVAATEAHTAVEDDSPIDHNLSDADRFLIKKAYRKAASIAHPDRGGDAETFQAVHAAYLANDLKALTEFVLSHDLDLLDQIAYWRVQMQKPAIDWESYTATSTEFGLVAMSRRGMRAKAVELAGAHLQAVLLVLMDEEVELLTADTGGS